MTTAGVVRVLATLLAQAQPVAPAAAAPPPATRSVPAAAVLRAIAAGDPPIDALRAAASALALTEPARARSLVRRARVAGWLPELRARVDRRLARGESVDLGASITTALAPVGIDSDNDVRYELRATWDLAKFAFNPDEIAAHFQALRTADARREIESLVIRLFFERRRLKADLNAADANDMSHSGLKLELRIEEIEAELDALTGGAFSRLRRPAAAEAVAP